MENEKFQQLVLQTLAQLTEGQKSLEDGQNSLIERQQSLEEGQQSLIERQKSLEEGQQSLIERQKSLEEGQKELKSEVIEIKESQIRMEQELGDKVRALYDAREVQTDINTKILATLGRIEAKVDVLQMETSNIRRVK